MPPTKKTTTTPKRSKPIGNDLNTLTPNLTPEPPSSLGSASLPLSGSLRRRSLRLASISISNDDVDVDSTGTGIRVLNGPESNGAPFSDSKAPGSECSAEAKGKGKGKGKTKSGTVMNGVVEFGVSECKGNERGPGYVNLRSGKKVLKKGLEDEDKAVENCGLCGNGSGERGRETRKGEDEGNGESEMDDLVVPDSDVDDEVKLDCGLGMKEDAGEGGDNSKRGKRKLGGTSSQNGQVNGDVGEGLSRIRRRLSREEKGKGVVGDGDLSGDVCEGELGVKSEMKEYNVDLQDREEARNVNIKEHGSGKNLKPNARERGPRRSSRRSLIKEEEKGEAVMVDGDLSGEGELGKESEMKDLDVNGSEDDVDLKDREGSRNGNTKEHGSRRSSRRRLSKEEKGKAVMVDGDLSGDVGDGELGIESEVKDSDVDAEDNVASPDREQSSTMERGSRRKARANTRERGSRRNVNPNPNARERFRDIARENASRFAYFQPNGSDDNQSSPEQPEVEPEIEDWPGPFSTAMKIIKDRALKSVPTAGVSSERNLVDSIKWVPKRNEGDIGASFSVPSLQELCLKILAKNVDAVVSLDSVPDALRHKLSQLLCDSRKINGHFFELLVCGSPTEIRLRDCSWLTEEQFTTSFQTCDTANLVVLQLDQCGRCLPDYVLLATLAQSPRHLPTLTSLSLSGACRLSDGGLRALISSAPALRSINLSLCSLLTSSSVYILAESLKSLLKELYLDDCHGIDAALIVPALLEFEHLEVLSVAGIQTVGDKFVKDYVTVRGHNLKELVLKDCINLTDASMKVIAEHCPGLCVLDLTNLCKLTDLSIGYLTNGCRALHTLKLCRNAFSDEAIAAFVESTGESLKELSLNNVKKVGYHTTMSLANHAKNLHTLDLSWCRNLTDNALGLIVDSCLSLRLLKLFGCTQVTDAFLNGHSNLQIQLIGLKMSPVLQHVKVPDPHKAALNYSSVSVN
ncbi:hypothetical protein RIF29_09130 [Crotalaria pallida]|uniref:F-box/LRR-repeat protein 15-like leucin rich repeat domain-containing protein n=1 Tax=Crotalaria pallida TaxID=3830 RepID=A0AAN9FRM9_CROPI